METKTPTDTEVLEAATAEVEGNVREGQEVVFIRQPSQQDIHLNAYGQERVSGIPMAPPIGYKKVPSLSDQIRDMVRSERLKQEAEAAGFESFDEADDFEVGDDYDPSSPYENEFEPEVPPAVKTESQPTPPKDEAPATPPPATEATEGSQS